MTSGVIYDIKRHGTVGETGRRATVYTKGCPLRCLWCSVPESHTPAPELLVWSDRCAGSGRCEEACAYGAAFKTGLRMTATDRSACVNCGRCATACPSGARSIQGRVVEVEEVLAELDRGGLFMHPSGNALVVTGGEPLLQPEFTAELLRAVRLRGVRTIMETCGHAPWTDFVRVLPFTNLFRFDVKHVEPLRHRRLTGVGNQVILANLKNLAVAGAQVIVRMPLVPGCNADAETVLTIARLTRDMLLPELHLVPYHNRGERKYLALGRGYPLDGA
ncbi:MAG: glycyl-radical enzyme activating protein, partial [Chloroflexota bacterium]